MEKPVAINGGWIVLGAAGVVLLMFTWAWRVLNWLWFTPKRLERCLQQQGFSGNPYRLLVGDMTENSQMIKEAMAKPISLTDDCAPRVFPFLYHIVKTYGKNSFSWNGPVPRVTIMNPEHIKEILNRITDFPKQAGSSNPLSRLVGTGLACHEGEKWAKHRRIISPAFHLDKLKNMVPAFYDSCSDMINKWEELVSGEGFCELDAWPYLVNLTSEIISRTAFGSSYEEGKRIFQLQDELAILTRQVSQSIYIPGWRFVPTKFNRKIKAVDKEIRASLKKMIENRERAMKAGEVSNDDLLGILMESNSREIQEHGDNKNVGMNMADVIDECKIFYFAGQETTSVLLVWTMILLASHTTWQSRARDEVFKVFGNKKPDLDGLNRLKVVTMILYEVMRLYPPGTMLLRSVVKETRLGDLLLPAGVSLALPIILVHHDRELWGDDAMEFKPERFAEGVSKATKNQVSFFPFAWGPRICIGQNFALAEAKMAVAMILQRFTFESSPSYTHAPCMVLTLHPQFGAHLILRKFYP